MAFWSAATVLNQLVVSKPGVDAAGENAFVTACAGPDGQRLGPRANGRAPTRVLHNVLDDVVRSVKRCAPSDFRFEASASGGWSACPQPNGTAANPAVDVGRSLLSSAPARNAFPASLNPPRLFVIRHCRPASFLPVPPVRHTLHRGVFLAGKRVSCTDPHDSARSPKKPGPPPERPGAGRIDGQIDMQFQLRGPRLKRKGSANEKRPPQRSRRARYWGGRLPWSPGGGPGRYTY